MDFDNLSNDDDFHSSFASANNASATFSKPLNSFNNMDPEVISLMSSLSATLTSPTQLGNNNRLFNSSSYAGSETGESDRLSNPFSGLNKDSLSVISAPYLNRGGVIKHNLFGSASIAGHVITQASPFDNSQRQPLLQKSSNFLEKFGSVADRTRDLENGLSQLGINDGKLPTDRRSSLLSNDQSQESVAQSYSLAESNSPTSLHETLNGSSSRHQSISDRIDSYQQEQERRLSFSSELLVSENGSTTTDHHQQIKHNIWNPASAHTFQPAPYQFPTQQQQQQQLLLLPPFFGDGSAPAPMFPNMYTPFLYPQGPPPQNQFGLAFPRQQQQQQQPQQQPDSPSNEKDKEGGVKPKGSIPGVNLLNRSMSPPAFMMPPFIPFGMFPPMPFPGTPPMQQVKDGVAQGGAAAAGFQQLGIPPLNLRDTPSPPLKNNGKKSPHRNKNSPQPQLQQQQQQQTNSKSQRSRNGPSYIQRSPLLEQFRANTSGKEYKLSDIYGHGIEFSKDQHGSRFIQAQLANSSDEEKEVIFNEIRDISFELMSDVFGNYVIQKYFEFGNDVQRKVLLDTMQSHIKELSLQMYGCRVVQRAIEHIQQDQKLALVSELDNANIILECCKDANGNHVIQKSIEIIPSENIEFIFSAIKDQIYHLSTNSFGCRVIQKLLEFGKVEQCEYIIEILEKYVDVLLIDKFGNYVIQYILTNESNCNTDKIIEIVNNTIMNDFTKLSANKFSSNVVESFITSAPLDSRLQIKKQSLEDNNNKLIRLINDPYGNYVVQKLVTVDINSKDETTELFVNSIRNYLEDAGNTNSKLSIEKLRNIIRSI